MINDDKYICQDCKIKCDYVHNIEDLYAYYVCQDCLQNYKVCEQCSAAYKNKCPDDCIINEQCYNCNGFAGYMTSPEGQNCEICTQWYCNNCEKLPRRNDDKYMSICINCYNENIDACYP